MRQRKILQAFNWMVVALVFAGCGQNDRGDAFSADSQDATKNRHHGQVGLEVTDKPSEQEHNKGLPTRVDKGGELLVLDRDRIVAQGDSIPRSEYVKGNESILSDARNGLVGWCAIGGNEDGSLPTTNNDDRPYLSLLVLVHNRSHEPIEVSALSMFIRMTDGEEVACFGGEIRNAGFNWLGPSAIEKDGEDVSLEKVTSLDLDRGHYGVFEVSFPMQKQMAEAQAIKLVDSLIVRATEPNNRTEAAGHKVPDAHD